MKCLLCPAEIDHEKAIPHALDADGHEVKGAATDEDKLRAVTVQRAHSRALNAWRQLVVALDEGNNQATGRHLIQGHICPGHSGLKAGDVTLSLNMDGGK